MWSFFDAQFGLVWSYSYNWNFKIFDFSAFLPSYPAFATKNGFKTSQSNLTGGFRVQLLSFNYGQLGPVVSFSYIWYSEIFDFSAFLPSHPDFATKNEIKTPQPSLAGGFRFKLCSVFDAQLELVWSFSYVSNFENFDFQLFYPRILILQQKINSKRLNPTWQVVLGSNCGHFLMLSSDCYGASAVCEISKFSIFQLFYPHILILQQKMNSKHLNTT